MIDRHSDIGDDEIRIISSGGGEPPRGKRRKPHWFAVLAGMLLVLGALAAIFLRPGDEAAEEPEEPVFVKDNAGFEQETTLVSDTITDGVLPVGAFTVVKDTVVNGVELTFLTPVGAVPVLEIGSAVLADSTAVLVTQAADIRSDNGAIAGAYVLKGELLGKGEAKAGFCSIINGEITVGVADATPMLEQALMSDGYFFRQYPLVVGGQIVENRPKGKAIRKALVEMDGKISVVISRQRVTFHDFSQALTDAGVRNAIYLVGADSSGLYRDADGNRFVFGTIPPEVGKNVNFIVWR